MARKPHPTPLALKFVQRLKTQFHDADRLDHLVLTHRVAIASPDGRVPRVFTIEICRGRRDRFVATCREFPAIFVAAESEREVLMRTERQIRQRLRTSI